MKRTKGNSRKNIIIALTLAFAMFFSLFPGQNIYGAETDGCQGLDPDNGNGIAFIAPEFGFISAVEEEGGYYLNEITEVYDGRERLEFFFRMSAGMSEGLANFTSNNLDLDLDKGDAKPTQVNIYKVEDRNTIEDEYDGNWSNDKTPVSNYNMGSLKLDPDKTISKKDDPKGYGQIALYVDNVLEDESLVLSDGTYILEFGSDLCGNNTSKIVGVPIGYIFSVTGAYTLEDAIPDAGDMLTAVSGNMGTQKGQYNGLAEQAELERLLGEAEVMIDDPAATEQSKTDLAYLIKEAISTLKKKRIVQIELGEINGVDTIVKVADTGQAGITVNTDPDDSNDYKDIKWSASDNITINSKTGEWSANYAGSAYITAVSNWEDAYAGSVTTKTFSFDIQNSQSGSSVNIPYGKSLEDILSHAGINSSNTEKLKIHTGARAEITSSDLAYLKSIFSSNLIELDLGDAVFSKLPEEAFKDFSDLKTVVLPDNVTQIGSRTFQNCTSLESVNIPSCVKYIGDDIFNGCGKLSSTLVFSPVRPPEFASKIDNSFRNSGITTIEVSYGCKEDYEKYINNTWGSSVIKISENDTEVRLDITVTTIGGLQKAADDALDNAGRRDYEINTLYIKTAGDAYINDTKDIPYLQSHFLNATNINLVETDHQDNRFKANVFKDRVNVKKVRLSKTITNIGNDAFNGCLNLKDIVLPASLEQMNGRVFAGCVSLPSYMVLNSVDPPSYNGSFPSNITIIAVPNGSEENYRQAIGWSQYGDNIIPQINVSMDAKEKNIEVQTEGQLSVTVDVRGDHDIGDKVTWSSSDEKIVRVDSNGKFKGIRPGMATVTVAADDYTDAEATCVITVRSPSAPALKIKSNSYNSASLTWSKVSGASGYEIFRSATKTGGYSKIRTLSSSSSSYTDTGLNTGTTYYYKVRVYKDRDGVRYAGEESSVVSTKPVLSAVTGFKVKKYGSKKTKLSWKKKTGANGYEIYRATKKNGKYKKIKTIRKATTKKYINKKLKKNKTYYYKIRAYRKIGTKKVYGTFSKRVKIKTR